MDTTLDGFVADGARVSRCPLTHALRVHADAGSSSGSGDTPRAVAAPPAHGGAPVAGLSPATLAIKYGRKGALLEPAAFEDYSDGGDAPPVVTSAAGSVLRAQVNHANLVNAVIAHTTWHTHGDATTLATAARATASPC